VLLVAATARLRLRSFTRADAEAAHRVYGDPDVMRYIEAGRPAAAQEDSRAMIDAYIEHERIHGFSFYAVIEAETGVLVGDAGLYRRERDGREVELGYTLGREWWGLGYATEAARACLEIAFGRVGLDQVIALVIPDNRASIRVLEKVGMSRVGPRFAHGREHVLFRLERSGFRSGGGGPPL
jgi:[ribosomal protein S5]-alanine N-acetyltransferase